MRSRFTARSALAVAAWLFVACIVVQVFLAGLGVFDRADAFVTHRYFGYLFGWLTLVMLVLAVAGRVGRRLIGLCVLALVQFALQSVFVAVRADLPAVAALHPVNGMALLLVGVAIARIAWNGRVVSTWTPDPAKTDPQASRA